MSILNSILLNKPLFAGDTVNNSYCDISESPKNTVSDDKYSYKYKKYNITLKKGKKKQCANVNENDIINIDDCELIKKFKDNNPLINISLDKKYDSNKESIKDKNIKLKINTHNSICDNTNDAVIINKINEKVFNKIYNNIKKYTKLANLNNDINLVQHKYNLVNNIKRHILRYNKTFPPSIHNIFYINNFFDIIKDPGNVPFWNNDVLEKSRGLFLPIEAFMKNDITSFTKNTWFDCEFKKEKYPCFHLKELNYTPENIIQPIYKTKNIKLNLTKQQTEAMKRLIGVYRYFYNRTLDVFKNYDTETNISYYYIDSDDDIPKYINIPLGQTVYNFFFLRPILKTNYPKWIINLQPPSHLIDLAIKEAVEKTKENLSKHKKFEMKRKTKKDIWQTINIEKSTIKKDGVMKGFNYKGDCVFKKVKMSESIENLDYGTSSITYHSVLNTFTLNLSYTTQNSTNKTEKVGAIDPGLREFMVIFSDNKVCKIGIDCTKRLFKICKELDIIQSRINIKTYYVINKVTKTKTEYKVNSQRKRRLRKALHRKIKKIQDLKKELHDQTINYMCENYSKIIIPPFETQNMVCKLKSSTARMMYNLSFYEFRKKLIEKGKERNCKIIIKPEGYTSKTCTRCGTIKNDLKMGDSIYICKNKNCGLVIDRNYNGARNIMLRNN